MTAESLAHALHEHYTCPLRGKIHEQKACPRLERLFGEAEEILALAEKYEKSPPGSDHQLPGQLTFLEVFDGQG